MNLTNSKGLPSAAYRQILLLRGLDWSKGTIAKMEQQTGCKSEDLFEKTHDINHEDYHAGFISRIKNQTIFPAHFRGKVHFWHGVIMAEYKKAQDRTARLAKETEQRLQAMKEDPKYGLQG